MASYSPNTAVQGSPPGVSGNGGRWYWRDSANWVRSGGGSGWPGDGLDAAGDVVTAMNRDFYDDLAHSSPLSFGTSGVQGTAAFTFGTTATGSIRFYGGSGGSIRHQIFLKGDMMLDGISTTTVAKLSTETGALDICFDNTAAADPANTKYGIKSVTNSKRTGIVCTTGSVTNPPRIRSITPGSVAGYVSNESMTAGPYLNAPYIEFIDIQHPTAGQPGIAIALSPDANGAYLTIPNARFIRTGGLKFSVALDPNVDLSGVTFEGTVGSWSIHAGSNVLGTVTGTRNANGLVCDKQADLKWAKGCTLDGAIFYRASAGLNGAPYTASGAMFRNDDGVGANDAVGTVPSGSTLNNCYLVQDTLGTPHVDAHCCNVGPNTTGVLQTTTLTNNIMHLWGTHGSGSNGFVIQNGTTFQQNILIEGNHVLPARNGEGSFNLLHNYSSNGLNVIEVIHNTGMAHDSSTMLMIATGNVCRFGPRGVQGNLVLRNGTAGNLYKLSNASPGTTNTDGSVLSYLLADRNAMESPTAGVSGKGYNITFLGGSPGANDKDIVGSFVFVSVGRNPANYVQSLAGYTGLTEDQAWTTFWTEAMKRNLTTFDSRFLWTTVSTWIKAGRKLVPGGANEEALRGAGVAGRDIGAESIDAMGGGGGPGPGPGPSSGPSRRRRRHRHYASR